MPQKDHTATLAEVGMDLATFDSGLALDPANNSADIPVSGGSDAPDGTVIEARLVAFHDKTDAEVPAASTEWQDVATLGMGTGLWFGVVSGPRNVGTEYRIEARVKGSAAPAARTTNRCRIGHIASIWGQSNESTPFFNQYDPLLDEGLIDGGAYAGDVIIVKRQGGDIDAEPGAEDSTVTVVNVTATNATGVSPGIVAIANAFSSVRPGEKFLLIANTKSGTGLQGAVTTAFEEASGFFPTIPSQSPQRDFREDEALHIVGTTNGATQVGLVFCPGWFASTGGPGVAPQEQVRYFTGRDPQIGGAKTSLATSYGNRPIPRNLMNTYADGTSVDGSGHDLRTTYDPAGTNSDLNRGGLYDYTKTRFAWSGLYRG